MEEPRSPRAITDPQREPSEPTVSHSFAHLSDSARTRFVERLVLVAAGALFLAGSVTVGYLLVTSNP